MKFNNINVPGAEKTGQGRGLEKMTAVGIGDWGMCKLNPKSQDGYKEGLANNSGSSPPMNSTVELGRTGQFWDASPCDGHADHESRKNWRYTKNPWLPPLIAEIASAHQDIVEIGCGQGTDGLTFCEALPEGARYRGFDYSMESIKSARNALAEAGPFSVTPEFNHGNAEELELETGSVDCIYSLGVLHHTPDTEKAVQEVLRVLKPGGKAYVLLYNSSSPKVNLAHILRACQRVLDRFLKKERFLYNFFYGRHFETTLGTAILEGFGVPVLRSYGRSGMKNLFREFTIVSLTGCGGGIPTGSSNPQFGGITNRIFGLYWFVVAEKPA